MVKGLPGLPFASGKTTAGALCLPMSHSAHGRQATENVTAENGSTANAEGDA